MEHSKGFDRAEYGLVPVRLERLGIFLFICFDSVAPGLGRYLADFPELVASHNLDDLVCVRRLQLDVPANWKVATENMFEGYHVPVVHGASLGRNDYSEGMSIINGKSNELFGADPDGPVRLWFRDSVSVMISRHPGSNALIAGARGFPPIESLEGVAREGSLYSFIYPSTFFPCNIDCVWYVTFFPVAADRSTLLIGQCFPAGTVERADFPDVIENYHKRLDLSIAEDLAIMKEQQAGLGSPFARAGRLCHHEAFVHHYRNWVVDRVLGTSTQGAPRGA
ncbi:MAG: RHO alpha subunit C-terminal catalytic domain-containing protein [Alphaproteobacteria bacterium]